MKSARNYGILKQAIVPILYALITIAYLWFAVKPSQFLSHLQTIDSVLMAVIMEHVSLCPFDAQLDFWNLGIFYPVQKTLCLSEPMLTPAVLMFPITSTMGYVVAFNCWIYFCWWSLAVAAWTCLRRIGIGQIASFWGGFFISFNPDRAWHAAGHGHLYFATGLFCSLIALEYALAPGSSWRSRLAFITAFLLQIFAGIYMTVIVAIWGLFVFPAAIWRSARLQNISVTRMLALRGKFLLLTLVLGGILYLPVIMGYKEFSENRAENPMEYLTSSSATIAGYIFPPATPERLMTLGGKLLERRAGMIDGGEDNQYLGAIAPVLLLFGLVVLLFKRSNVPNEPGQRVFLFAVLLAGAGTFILSLGPYTGNELAAGSRLPFAYLYAWVSEIRFFRAPARFAYGVEWTVGILAAWALNEILHGISWRYSRNTAYALGSLCVLATMVEFYPINGLYRIDSSKSEFSEWLLKQDNREPYVELPVTVTEPLIRLGWDHTPFANGYSGYAPANRFQELDFFASRFPAQESLSIMSHWKVKNVFIRSSESKLLAAAVASQDFKQLWSGSEGRYFELTTSTTSWSDIRQEHAERDQQQGDLITGPFPVILNSQVATSIPESKVVVTFPGMEVRHNGQYLYQKDPSVFVRFSAPVFSTASHCKLKIRYRLENWYDLREYGSLYWSDSKQQTIGESQKVEFIVIADGEFHDIEVPLDQSIAWIGSTPADTLRIDLGYRHGDLLTLEHLEFK